MGKLERQKLIKKIEEMRKSHVITYITSTRSGFGVSMAMDCIRKIYDHINTNERKNIDLYLMSNGGDATVPWRLVSMIREYTEQFSVIIPYRAFSAATLTALGADEILMHPMGMLGPTDQTVTNYFNPRDGEGGNYLGISVEDVTAYLAMIKEDAGIQRENEMVVAFGHLAEKVHPLALGNVKRSLLQSKMLATKLLQQSSKWYGDERTVEDIVDKFTSKLYYHGHPINRKEAKNQLGLKTVTEPEKELEDVIWNLYLDYEAEMLLEQPFSASNEFNVCFPALPNKSMDTTPEKELKLAFIESHKMTDDLSTRYRVFGKKDENGFVSVELKDSGLTWKRELN